MRAKKNKSRRTFQDEPFFFIPEKVFDCLPRHPIRGVHMRDHFKAARPFNLIGREMVIPRGSVTGCYVERSSEVVVFLINDGTFLVYDDKSLRRKRNTTFTDHVATT